MKSIKASIDDVESEVSQCLQSNVKSNSAMSYFFCKKSQTAHLL